MLGVSQDPWAIVLAGGDGLRLRPTTERLAGDARPKQFCALLGDEPLVVQTLRRASLSVPPEHQITVVTQSHAPYWMPLQDQLESVQFLAQPENRGTAAALLLGFLRVRALAGNTPLVVLPSDHYVSSDRLFMAHVDEALALTRTCPDSPILLGVEPASAEREYGWIEPLRLRGAADRAAALPVQRFWEKPSADTARALLLRGCLWNTMVIVGRVEGFLGLVHATLPDLVGAFEPLRSAAWSLPALERVYRGLTPVGFSERVLAAAPERCLVKRVAGVDWTDLGNPARLVATARRAGLPLAPAVGPPRPMPRPALTAR